MPRASASVREVEMQQTASRVWSIVLAGGEGERMRMFIEHWLGTHQPKQYCTFVGTRSLLQHTVDRADRISPEEQRITVVARHHCDVARAQLAGRGGHLLLQPANRGTAAGVFLPLAQVRAADPHATVVIYPADHFVWPEERFAWAIARAVQASEACPDRPILIGVAPESAEGDYGWIVPGQTEPNPTSAPRPIERFREKPSASEAAALLQAGGLWNTLVIVAQAETLWRLGQQHLPELLDRFDTWSPRIGGCDDAATLDTLYGDMPVRDFSRDLLEPSAANWQVFPLDDVLWSDWGRPQRLIETLLKIGRVPTFWGETAVPGATASIMAHEYLASPPSPVAHS